MRWSQPFHAFGTACWFVSTATTWTRSLSSSRVPTAPPETENLSDRMGRDCRTKKRYRKHRRERNETLECITFYSTRLARTTFPGRRISGGAPRKGLEGKRARRTGVRRCAGESRGRCHVAVQGQLALGRGEVARADPYVTSGAVKRWHVREWTTVVGEDAATPIRPNTVAAGKKTLSESSDPVDGSAPSQDMGMILRMWKAARRPRRRVNMFSTQQERSFRRSV